MFPFPLVILGALVGGALFMANKGPKSRPDLFSTPPYTPEAETPTPVAAPSVPTAVPGQTSRLISPLANARLQVTSPYGPRVNPVTGEYQSLHNGLDLSAPLGTPIYAVEGGRVSSVWLNHPTNGNAVKISHPNGMSTAYLHMVEAPMVVMGQVVAKGQQIGRVGMTGRATGPHLHFIVYLPSGQTTDPKPWIDPSPWTPSRGTALV